MNISNHDPDIEGLAMANLTQQLSALSNRRAIHREDRARSFPAARKHTLIQLIQQYRGASISV